MGLEDVVAGALAAAREDGTLDAAADEGTATEVEETTDEGSKTGDEEETPAEGDESAEAADDKGGDDEDEVDAEADTDDSGEADDKSAGAETDKDKKTPKADDDPLKAEIDGAKGADNRLPIKRVQAIAANAAKREAAKLYKETAEAFGLDVEKVNTPEMFTKVVKSVQSLRARQEGMDALEPIMREDPDTFVTMLAEKNPGYRKFLKLVGEGEGAEETKETKEVVTPATARPEPDLTIMVDGKEVKTYSLEGADKLVDWKVDQRMAKIEAKIGERIKPFEKRDEDAKARQDMATSVERELQDLVTEAKGEWDGYSENEAAILAYAKEKIPQNVPMGRALRRAYNEVVVKKRTTDRAKIRAEVHEENKKAAKSTSVKADSAQAKKKTGTARGEDGQVVSGTEAAVRNAVAQARAEGRL